MTIAFKCRCGRSMRVRDDNAGKKVRCPDCGKGVVIPPLDPNTDDEIKALKDWAKHTDRSQRDAGRATPQPANKKAPGTGSQSASSTITPPPKGKLKSKKAAVQNKEQSFPLLYVGALGVVLLLAGLIWMIWLR